MPGYNVNLLPLLEELDIELASIGGKIYLVKDSRQTSFMFKKSYLFMKSGEASNNKWILIIYFSRICLED